MNAVKPVWLWLPEATEQVIVGEYQLSNTGGRPLGASSLKLTFDSNFCLAAIAVAHFIRFDLTLLANFQSSATSQDER